MDEGSQGGWQGESGGLRAQPGVITISRVGKARDAAAKEQRVS